MKFIKISTARSFVYLNAAICEVAFSTFPPLALFCLVLTPLTLLTLLTLLSFRVCNLGQVVVYFRRCVPCFRPRLSPPSSAIVYVPFVYPDFINHTPRAPLHDKRVFRCRWQDSHFLRLSVKLLQRIGNIADIDDCIEIVQKCFLVRPQRYSSGRVYFKTHSTHPYCSWGIALCGLVTQELIPYRSMGKVMKSAI